MFALKNFAFFGHMDGWEYQDRIMALCSFMCDALCSVFPKMSNQAWGWTVPFRRIFNWKVKISTRPGNKSCCFFPSPALLCVCLSPHIHMYESFTQLHSFVIPFLRLGASNCPAATRGPSSQRAHSSAGWISAALTLFTGCGVEGWGWSGGWWWGEAPDTHLLMGLLAFHHCCALLAAWHVCVSINHVLVDQDFP